MAFLFNELADFAVFASNLIGLVIDSILFLQIALGSLDFIEGQIIARSGPPCSRSWCCEPCVAG